MIGEHKLGFTNDDQVRWNNNFEVREREGWKYIFIELEAKLKKNIFVIQTIRVIGSCRERKTCVKNLGTNLIIQKYVINLWYNFG